MAELSSRYAAAIFDLAIEDGRFNEFFDQVVFLHDALQVPEYLRIIGHPHISTADKNLLINNAFAGNINDNLLGFLLLVVDKRRESFLIPAFKEFIDMGNRYIRKATANVVSATELSESQVLSLKNVLSKKLNKDVDIKAQIDASVIGGISIYVDGLFIDRTVRKQLIDMKYSIKRGSTNDSQA